MRPQISRILLVAAIAGLVLASPAGARPVFDGKVCGLLTAKQIATVPGLSPACRNARPTKGLGSTMYVGNWPGKTPTSPILQVTIARYTDSGALQLAKRNLLQGLPGGAWPGRRHCKHWLEPRPSLMAAHPGPGRLHLASRPSGCSSSSRAMSRTRRPLRLTSEGAPSGREAFTKIGRAHV